MSVTALLSEVEARGVELWIEGSRLRFRAPAGALLPTHREQLRAMRADVIAALRARASAALSVSPLSQNQRALWFIHQEAPRSSAYHVAFAARISTPIDIVALRDAVQAVADRHQMLRTTYVLTDDAQLQMETRGAVPIPLVQLDLIGASEATLRDAVDAECARPFDLEVGPVFRCTLLSRSDTDHVLLVCVHHIASDGWSLMIIADELYALYAEGVGAASRPLSRPARTYTDFVDWQSRMLDSAAGEQLAAAWKTTLAPPRAELEVPPDRPRPARKSYRGGSEQFSLPAERVALLRTVARENSTTIFVVLLAAYKALLFRLSGTEDIIVGTPTFGRSQAEFTQTVGHFVNPVPMRTTVTAGLSFRELLQRVSHTVRAALTAQDYPLLLMVQHAQVAREPSRSPLFETFFGLVAFDRARDVAASADGAAIALPREVAGLVVDPYPLLLQLGQFDLALQFAEHEGTLDGALLYSSDLYDADTAARMCAHYLTLLTGALENMDQALDQLPPRASTGHGSGCR